MPPEPLLEVRNLCIELLPRRGILSGVSFDIPMGTIAGLSGDSGSGKTTLALALLKLLPPDQYDVSGQVLLRGRDLLASMNALEPVRGAQIAMIFRIRCWPSIRSCRLAGRSPKSCVRGAGAPRRTCWRLPAFPLPVEYWPPIRTNSRAENGSARRSPRRSRAGRP
jgi:energy-coupling factor transporter ATP-binding protein EcfA2